jgi:hypothetical protein
MFEADPDSLLGCNLDQLTTNSFAIFVSEPISSRLFALNALRDSFKNRQGHAFWQSERVTCEWCVMLLISLCPIAR